MQITSKKIAMISYHTCPTAIEEGTETGGMNTYVLELSKALVQAGERVDLFTRSHGESSIRELAKGLRLIHLPAGPNVFMSPKKLYPYIDEFSENFLNFGENYDIIHCHYYLSGLVGLKIKHDTPLFMSFHTLALLKNLVAKEHESVRRIQSEKLIVQQAQKIVAHCEQEVAYLKGLYGAEPNKTSYVYPGVNLDVFKPTHKASSKRKLLFVGRIQALKGIDCLLYSLKFLSEYTLEIVGAHFDTRKLKKLIETLGLSAQVTIHPQCPQSKLAEYYQNADLLILPSLYESFGLVAIEALACGTPAIVTENCGVAEFVKTISDKWVVPANNPLALAKAILSIKKPAETSVEKFAWSNVAKKMQKLYSEI